MKDDLIMGNYLSAKGQANIGQSMYVLFDAAHKIKEVLIDGKPVEYEVVVILRSAPTKKGSIEVRTTELLP